MLSFKLAIKYLFSKKKYGVINLILWLAASVTILVGMAMVVVLSTFNGIEGLVLSLYQSLEPPYRIEHVNQDIVQLSSTQLESIEAIEGVEAISKQVEAEVVFRYQDQEWYGNIVGVDENFCQMSQLKDLAELRDCDFKSSEIVLGAGIRYHLQYQTGRALEPLQVVYLPKDEKLNTRTMSRIKQASFVCNNEFSVNAEYDLKYAYLSLNEAQRMLGFNDGEFTAVNILISENADENQVISEIEILLANDLQVKASSEKFGDLKRTSQIEKWISFLVMIFILVVAAFNLVAAISMLIIEKRKDLDMLRILGMENVDVRYIFSYIIFMINGAGAVLGILVGYALVWGQNKFGFISISQSVVESYPVEWKWSDAIFVLMALLFTGILSQLPINWIVKRS